MFVTCCSCAFDMDIEEAVICSECAGFCCNDDCLCDHECDPVGDL